MVYGDIKAALAGQYEGDLLERLTEPLTLTAFTGLRSARAALDACQRLMLGDVNATIPWLNLNHIGESLTHLELAEQSEEGLHQVRTSIRGIEHGVYF